MLPSPACVIFSDEHIFFSTVALFVPLLMTSLIAGGGCNSTYSLNITEGLRLTALGGLKNPDVQG